MNDFFTIIPSLYVCEKFSHHKKYNYLFLFAKNIKFLKKLIFLILVKKQKQHNTSYFYKNFFYSVGCKNLTFFFLSTNLHYNYIFHFFTNNIILPKIPVFLLMLNIFLDHKYAPLLILFFKNF